MQIPTEAVGEERAARDDTRGVLPGLALAGAIAVGTGGAFLAWGLPALAGHQRGAGVMAASALGEVSPSDVAGALSTMDVSDQLRSVVAQKVRRCALHLAWVSAARVPGQAGGTIRLQSGHYFSPLFKLADAAVRVAIPYPGPYEGGHGTIGAFMVQGGALVGMQPAWRVTNTGGESFRDVTWRPRACPDAND